MLIKKEPEPESGLIPIRVSLLENLIVASQRIGEYCLAKKYLEELFESESSYFKRGDATDSFFDS